MVLPEITIEASSNDFICSGIKNCSDKPFVRSSESG